MEGKDIERLREEQLKAVQSTDDELNKWEKFQSDYTALQDRLRTLPDKLTHPVMVPFGSKAFMPGQLVHTNEVLVLLGDNWFVDRSAKQACEIIDRRLVGINKQICDLKKQRDLLQPRVDFTAQLQGMADAQARGEMMEIREEYDPVKERKWREQHRKNVAEHRRQLMADKKKEALTESVRPCEDKAKTDAELWARLDELERIETSRKELSRLTVDGEIALNNSAEVSQRTVRFADQHRDSDDDSEDNQEEITDSRPKSIRFSHSKSQEASLSTETPESNEDVPSITSPADIYRVFAFGHPTFRSILKPQPTATTTTDDTTTTTHTESVKKMSKVQAFSGSIIERDTASVISDKKPELPEADTCIPKKTRSQKRVSKFKADRQKQQSDSNTER